MTSTVSSPAIVPSTPGRTEWSIADAFYTPVATRLRTYGVDLATYGDDGTAQAYVERLLADPAFLEWEAQAVAEMQVPA